MPYGEFVRTYRALVHGSESSFLKAMRFLVDSESKSHLWSGGPHQSYHALLTKERLCTWRLYTRFRTACSLLKVATVNLLGVYGAAQFASMPAAVRPKILTAVKRWARKNRRAPSYQTVAEFIKQIAPRPTTRRKSSVKALQKKIEELEAVIERLESKLKEARHGRREGARAAAVGRRPQSGALPSQSRARRGRSKGHDAHRAHGTPARGRSSDSRQEAR